MCMRWASGGRLETPGGWRRLKAGLAARLGKRWLGGAEVTENDPHQPAERGGVQGAQSLPPACTELGTMTNRLKMGLLSILKSGCILVARASGTGRELNSDDRDANRGSRVRPRRSIIRKMRARGAVRSRKRRLELMGLVKLQEARRGGGVGCCAGSVRAAQERSLVARPDSV
jgi:hypothetical protein